VTDRQRVMALVVRHSYLVSNYTYKTRNKQRKRVDRRASHAQSLSTSAARRRRSKRRHLGLVSVTLTARYTRAARAVSAKSIVVQCSFASTVRGHGCSYPYSRRRHGPCSRLVKRLKRCLYRPVYTAHGPCTRLVWTGAREHVCPK